MPPLYVIHLYYIKLKTYNVLETYLTNISIAILDNSLLKKLKKTYLLISSLYCLYNMKDKNDHKLFIHLKIVF